MGGGGAGSVLWFVILLLLPVFVPRSNDHGSLVTAPPFEPGSIILFFVAHWLAAPIQDKPPAATAATVARRSK